MKQIVRYRFMTIPNKLVGDLRVTIDESSHAENRNMYNGGVSTNLVILPMINIEILRPVETNDNGRRFRPHGNSNDSIGLTKFNYPTFLNEIKTVYESMKTPNMFVYRGERLDINDKECEKARRAFTVGRTSVELKPTIIEQMVDGGQVQRLEGIKMKFNNEDSTVLLTIREIESLIWILASLNIDTMVFLMYTNFIERVTYERQKPVVDIQPMARPVYNQAKPVAYTSVPEVPKEISSIPDELVNITEAYTPKSPVVQEAVLSTPPAKYSLDSVIDETEEKDDFANVMNPPVEA